MSGSDLETSDTFDGWRDRLVYLLLNTQVLIGAGIIALGIVIAVVQPSLPSVPGWAWDGLAAAFIFGPPLFLAGLKFARWLRTLRWVEVMHINVPDDDHEKYLVPPAVWSERIVSGPKPWRMDGKYIVREFDWDAELGELRVTGVWLSEVEDTKLVTSQSHFQAIYEYLVDQHLTLSVLREGRSRFGARLQDKLVTAMSEARERGQMMDKTAVKDVFEEFEEEANTMGEEEIPTFEDAHDLDADPTELAEEANPAVDSGAGGEGDA
jgi:hypothetical protein